MTRKKSGSKKKKTTATGGAPAAASAAQTVEASAPGLPFVLVAGEAFWKSVTPDDSPAEFDVEGDAMPSQAPGSVAASDLPALLTWFVKGLGADPAARLSFAPSLSKEERAAAHTAIGAAGLSAALESVSEGTGDARAISVYKKGAAPLKPVPSPALLERAATLYKWARDAGLTAYSRDEVVEQLLAGVGSEGGLAGLAPPLRAVWDARSAQQADAAQLAGLVAADDGEGVAALLKQKPALVGSVDDTTGQPPLHAAARLGCVGALRALVAAGAALEEKDAHGRTALQISRTFEQCDAEAVLLQAGAHDPEAGRFPLSLAAAQLGASDSPRGASEPQQQQAAAAPAPAAPAAAANGGGGAPAVAPAPAAAPATPPPASTSRSATAAAPATLAAPATPPPAAAAAPAPQPTTPAPAQAPAASTAASASAAAPTTPPTPATATTPAPAPAPAPAASTPAAKSAPAPAGPADAAAPSSTDAKPADPLAALITNAKHVTADLSQHVQGMLDQGRSWVEQNRGFAAYAGATAVVAGAVVLMFAGRRR